MAVKQRPAGSPPLPRLSSPEASYRPSNHIGWSRKQGTKRSREEWLTGESDSAWFLDRRRFPRPVAASLLLGFFPPDGSPRRWSLRLVLHSPGSEIAGNSRDLKSPKRPFCWFPTSCLDGGSGSTAAFASPSSIDSHVPSTLSSSIYSRRSCLHSSVLLGRSLQFNLRSYRIYETPFSAQGLFWPSSQALNLEEQTWSKSRRKTGRLFSQPR